MNTLSTLASRAVRPAEVSRRHRGPASLPSLIATWRQRIRFRKELEEMAKTNPHMICDIGLKKWQVEAEIAKAFWQA